ncbi:response regulator [Caenispirillum bisanense]|uniref:CheY chemotaxis protein or a CheY-like REC (Receiver) domain n=1 Tax=Caenispirillum bisanense TaxID=414052 RepID=A0A286GLH5_9PROT|nr:response regulator [Caenispirillum bisanense]SOD95949.1 CheY chemotaxis protein or a CheY-like REC (receiver) domain [Caenispirillum bisanense]
MAGLDLSNVIVLVAEDNTFSRQLMRTTLRALTVGEIQEAVDGVEALEMVRHRMPDLVFTDFDLPHLDGIEFTRLVRTGMDSPNPFLPVVMISAHATRFHVLAARDAGVNEYLVKPFSAAGLFSRMRAVIESPRRYVRTKTYFGPDRRRRDDPLYRGPDRRGRDVQPTAPQAPREYEMTQEQIDRDDFTGGVDGGRGGPAVLTAPRRPGSK